MTPKIRVADPAYNAGEICKGLKEAYAKGAKIIVFPELCITGYTCGDLFLQELLLVQAREALDVVADATEGSDALVFVGLPVEKDHKLYNGGGAAERRGAGFYPEALYPILCGVL